MRQRRFLVLWTLAVLATTCAFVVHLALRGKTVDLGYRLGHARNEQASLRESKRVLELEVASYQTPERVERVARTLLGMTPPPPERVIPLWPLRAPAAASATASAGTPGSGDGATAVPAGSPESAKGQAP